jgi:hypothetical protein
MLFHANNLKSFWVQTSGHEQHWTQEACQPLRRHIGKLILIQGAGSFRTRLLHASICLVKKLCRAIPSVFILVFKYGRKTSSEVLHQSTVSNRL